MRLAILLGLAGLAGCAADPCVDDGLVYYERGALIHATGFQPGATYDIAIVADGHELALAVPSAGEDEVELGGGVTLRATIPQTTTTELQILVETVATDGSIGGPASVSIQVSHQGQLVGMLATSPDYAFGQPGGPSCPSYRGVELSMSLAAL